jgi:hypothetical protein
MRAPGAVVLSADDTVDERPRLFVEAFDPIDADW